MKKILLFTQQHMIWVKAAFMALLPVFCCFVTSKMQGYSISDVYLPASEWNDELFYFKQVEGILHGGFPYGYFGFNESRALSLSFAAWSPVLVFPWILMGVIFGWGFLTPIYSNILFLSIAIFLFVVLVKPKNKQLGILVLLFCLFTPFTRYMLSGMPEVICFSMLIIFFALSVNYLEYETTAKLTLLFIMAILMTWMRPYLILFLLLPMFLSIQKNKVRGIWISLSVLIFTGIVYVAINYFLSAEYFTVLFDTEFITVFFEKGIWAGLKYTPARLLRVGKVFTGMTIESFKSGLPAGARFAGFLAVFFVMLGQTWSNYRQKDRKKLILHGHLSICIFGMLMALLLMYKMDEGSKHLLTFIAVGIFAISIMETKYYKKVVFLGAIFVYLFSIQAQSDYEYQIPFQNEERVQEIAIWRDVFADNLILQTEEIPNYENVIIWTFKDQVEGETELLDWQVLYALPEGFGISCCMDEYLIDNFDSLQSKYIAVPIGGILQGMCEDASKELLYEYGNTAVYIMHS